MQVTTAQDIQDNMGFHFIPNGTLSHKTIAYLIRLCVSRWGICRASDVKSYMINLFRNLNLNTEENRHLFNETLNNLITIGDIQEVEVRQIDQYNRLHQHLNLQPIHPQDCESELQTNLLTKKKVLMPNAPTTVQCGNLFFEIGCSPIELEPSPAPNLSNELRELVRWRSTAQPNVPVISLRAWLNRLSYQTETLSQLMDVWHFYTHHFDGSILDPNGVKVIGGQPGQFWGSIQNNTSGGRIQSFNVQLPKGWYCGWRQGYNDQHWTPCLISHQDQLLAKDIPDTETLLWLKLAHSQVLGQKEQMHLKEDTIERTTDLPRQILKFLEALSIAHPDWKTFQFSSPEVANAVAQILCTHCAMTLI